MKNRNLPFGYIIQNGAIRIAPGEAEIVRAVFDDYIAGASLKRIAEDLTARRVEFLPGEYVWNKNRIARLLADRRYSGASGYDPIIDNASFDAAQRICESRNTRGACAHSEIVSPAVVEIRCGVCGGRAVRVCDQRTAYRQKFRCADCGAEYRMTSETLNGLLEDLLRHAVIKAQPQTVTSLEVRRMENEIARLFDMPSPDGAMIRRLIFDVAAEKYRLLTAGREITDKLRTDLAPANLSSSNIRKTVMETVSMITLTGDETIDVTLINGQVLRKEQANGTGGSENRSDDSAERIPGTKEGVA
jgi:hypothetical protein